MASDRGQNPYSDFVALETLLRFENCSSSHCLLYFVASIPYLRDVASFVSSYCFLRGATGFSSWRSYGLMSSLRHFYAFVSTGLPFVDCASYLRRYFMYKDIYCTDFTCKVIPSLFSLVPCCSVILLLRYLVTLLLCYLVTLLPCYPVTLSLSYLVTLLPCYIVAHLPGYLVTLLIC